VFRASKAKASKNETHGAEHFSGGQGILVVLMPKTTKEVKKRENKNYVDNETLPASIKEKGPPRA